MRLSIVNIIKQIAASKPSPKKPESYIDLTFELIENENNNRFEYNLTFSIKLEYSDKAEIYKAVYTTPFGSHKRYNGYEPTHSQMDTNYWVFEKLCSEIRKHLHVYEDYFDQMCKNAIDSLYCCKPEFRIKRKIKNTVIDNDAEYDWCGLDAGMTTKID